MRLGYSVGSLMGSGEGIAAHAVSRAALAMLTDWGVAWGVLGVSRLHNTAATGEITSKTGAGQHALGAFGDGWHPVVQEALRCRPRPVAVPDPRRRPWRPPGAGTGVHGHGHRRLPPGGTVTGDPEVLEQPVINFLPARWSGRAPDALNNVPIYRFVVT